MNKKRIILWGSILFIGVILTGCAVYDSGYYGYPYYYDFDHGYPYYSHDHEFREHREFQERHEGEGHREFREHHEEGEHHHDRD